MWPWPDPRSRSRSFWTPKIAENCTFLGLSPPLFSRAAQSWWLIMVVWDLIYSFSKPHFRISFYENYHESSNFAQCRYFTTFKWPYFCSAWNCSQMVGRDGSHHTDIVHIDMTVTRSSPPACTASLIVGSSKAPWHWPWPWIGSRSHQHTQYVWDYQYAQPCDCSVITQ